MWSDVCSQESWGAAWPLFLTHVLLKVTIVLTAGGAIVWMMRQRTAAAKHLVWTGSLISCLLVPVTMLLLPGWGIERTVAHDSTSPHEASGVSTESVRSDPATTRPSPTATGGRVTPHSAAQFSTPPDQTAATRIATLGPLTDETSTIASPAWLLITWLTGFVIVLLPLTGGIARIAVLRRNSATVSGKSWNRLVTEVSHALHLRRSITLRRSPALDVPLCSGVIHPFVILPADSTWWTPERRRVVLLHELAHVRRADVPFQWICRLVCSVYWFHPLVWFAARRMRTEQERACDDLVLTVGTTTPSVYATHLVALAADCRNGRRHPVAAAAFARQGELESRIRCILQSDRPRRPLAMSLRSPLLVLMLGGMVSIATAGRVIVRDREGAVVATVPVPQGGTVMIEDATDEIQSDEGNLSDQIDAAIESSKERYLDAGLHSPYQIVRLLVPFGREHRVRLDGAFVNTIDFISGGPIYDGEPWFQKTLHGGRAHPFTIPYAFEGHLNQIAAWLSTADLPPEHEFQTPDGPITIAGMVRHAQATVNEREETTWTLWFLTKYLPQDAEWTNQQGQPWSMERLVRIQINADVWRAPSGGRPQLYALTLARNARSDETGELNGAWRDADRKIRLYVTAAKLRQNPDGSFPLRVFRTPDLSNIGNLDLEQRLDDDPFFLERLYHSGRHDADWNNRVRATGSVLAWLCIALPPEELDADWIRNAARYVATELGRHENEPMNVADLADGLHGLVAYRRHAGVVDATGE